jgi:hypothetical protein
MVPTGSPGQWQGCLIVKGYIHIQHCGHTTKNKKNTDRSDTKRRTLSALCC